MPAKPTADAARRRATWPTQHGRDQGDDGEEEGAGQGDAVEDLGEVALGLGPGPDAGDEAALLAQVSACWAGSKVMAV